MPKSSSNTTQPPTTISRRGSVSVYLISTSRIPTQLSIKRIRPALLDLEMVQDVVDVEIPNRSYVEGHEFPLQSNVLKQVSQLLFLPFFYP